MKCMMVVSDSSVRVSWETPDINNITGYTVIGYTVFYSLVYNQSEENGKIYNQSAENGIVIHGNSVNSINIDHLKNNRKYQFQVAVIAEIGEVFVTGERSQATSLNIVTLDKTTSTVDVAVDFGIRYFQAVPFVVGGAVIFIAFAPIVATMLFCLRRYVFVLAVLVMFLPSLLFIAQ